MSHAKKIDLGMTGYAELFMTDQERKDRTLPKIEDIPLRRIDDFPNHPFQVRMDRSRTDSLEFPLRLLRTHRRRRRVPTPLRAI